MRIVESSKGYCASVKDWILAALKRWPGKNERDKAVTGQFTWSRLCHLFSENHRCQGRFMDLVLFSDIEMVNRLSKNWHKMLGWSLRMGPMVSPMS